MNICSLGLEFKLLSHMLSLDGNNHTEETSFVDP